MENDTTLNLTPMAIERLTAMRNRVAQVGAAFGIESRQYAEAASSLAMCLYKMIQNGGEVRADDWGKLDLYCVGKHGMHYGVNFSEKRVKEEEFGMEISEEFQICGTWSVNS